MEKKSVWIRRKTLNKIGLDCDYTVFRAQYCTSSMWNKRIATEALEFAMPPANCAHFRYRTGKSQLFHVNEMNIWVVNL